MYKCLRCGKEVRKEDMVEELGVRCPYCGYRILVKMRPPIVKEIRVV